MLCYRPKYVAVYKIKKIVLEFCVTGFVIIFDIISCYCVNFFVFIVLLSVLFQWEVDASSVCC
jgi:hypothetical protein